MITIFEAIMLLIMFLIIIGVYFEKNIPRLTQGSTILIAFSVYGILCVLDWVVYGRSSLVSYVAVCIGIIISIKRMRFEKKWQKTK